MTENLLGANLSEYLDLLDLPINIISIEKLRYLKLEWPKRGPNLVSRRVGFEIFLDFR